MKKNGFTLIELVVVIVILGILAVVAAPKFMNLQNDARNASLKGLEGSLNSALGITYSKLTIMGLENNVYVTTQAKWENAGPGIYGVKIPLPGCNKSPWCTFRYGYPDAHRNTLKNLISNFNQDWAIAYNESNGEYNITFKQFVKPYNDKNGHFRWNVLTKNNCYISYAPPISATSGYTLKLIKCS
ncbi:prepilin-type N-terminal cleavage/methylation domain-containing protein [Photobacterium sp. S4TG1]|uniref:type II secretion system protein n=1 Tax=Photobacterium sp. S4TG1 TaxID=3114587 RepID=UPI002E186EFF|nr:prepilin-type N-terminal cleavage/methylation domain-containing protein [Photobacterium sp. S4TG1]